MKREATGRVCCLPIWRCWQCWCCRCWQRRRWQKLRRNHLDPSWCHPLPFALVRPIDSIKYFYRHLWYFTQPISFLLFHPAHDPPTPFKPRKSISAGSCPDLMQHFQLAEAQIHSDEGIPFQAAGARCSVTRPAIDAKLRHVFFTRVSIHYITGARLLWNGMTETQTRIPFQMVDAQPVDRRWAKFT